MNPRKAIIIYGPTGVGKSALTDKLAPLLPVEVVNMDSGALYAPLTIGTAKPDWQSSSVVHHLFDSITEPRDCTVVVYRNLVKEITNEVWQRGNVPLLVGGSGFYLKSLFFPPMSGQEVLQEKEKESEKGLWEKLNLIDPARASLIHPHDTYRIKRALSIWQRTGRRPTCFKPVHAPLFASCHLLYITRDRKDLYMRINERVNQMIQQGLIEEVRNLYDQDDWRKFLKRKKIIGYNDFFEFFESKQSEQNLQQIIKRIQKRTRAYAKRQEAFWRMLKKELNAVTTKHDGVSIESTNASRRDNALYIEHIMQYINSINA